MEVSVLTRIAHVFAAQQPLYRRLRYAMCAGRGCEQMGGAVAARWTRLLQRVAEICAAREAAQGRPRQSLCQSDTITITQFAV
jgi:hypothetical protein